MIKQKWPSKAEMDSQIRNLEIENAKLRHAIKYIVNKAPSFVDTHPDEFMEFLVRVAEKALEGHNVRLQ